MRLKNIFLVLMVHALSVNLSAQVDLFQAIKNDDLESVKHWFNAGGNPDIINENQQTPLMIAAKRNKIKMVHEILLHGPDLNQQDDDGMSALMFALDAGNGDIAKILLNLAPDIDINLQDDMGRTALMYAVNQNLEDCVEILLKRGADLNELEKNGYDLVGMACANKYMPLAKKLILAGARPQFVLLGDAALQDAKRYFINLAKGVSRRWNFPSDDDPLTLRELALKQMYEDYLNGSFTALIELLADQRTPHTITSNFKPEFLEKIRLIAARLKMLKKLKYFFSAAISDTF